MTIDFKLKTDPEKNDEIYSKDGYVIEMNPATNNELPIIIDDLSLLYNQSVAIIPTINKGQLIESPDFGITPTIKQRTQNDDITGKLYQMALMDELSAILTDFFLENDEITEYVSNNFSTIEILPTRN